MKEIEVNRPHIHLSKEVKQKLLDLNQSDAQPSRRGGIHLSTMKDSSLDQGSLIGESSIQSKGNTNTYLVKAGQRFLRQALVHTQRKSPALRSPQSRGSPCSSVYPVPALILPVIPGSIATSPENQPALAGASVAPGVPPPFDLESTQKSLLEETLNSSIGGATLKSSIRSNAFSKTLSKTSRRGLSLVLQTP